MKTNNNNMSIDLIRKYYVLIKEFDKNIDKNNNNSELIENSIFNELIENSIFNELIEKISNNEMNLIISNETKLWQKLVKKTLKISLNENLIETEMSSKLLQILINLINKLTPNERSLETTFDLICGHSMFNNILIDENYINSQLKSHLVSILCLIYEKDNNLCKDKNQMIELLLSAYNSSMTKTDQQLLRLLSLMEKNGCNLYKYLPFLWGINGAIHYSIKIKDKSTLLKEPKMEEIFSAINENKLKFSLSNFVIDLNLNPIEIIDIRSAESQYDPRFLLPLFYHLLSSQSIVKCHKFVSFGALSYTIVCLSSSCHRMRALAYCVLSRFYEHLESATFPRDRFLWIALLDYIRSGITSDNIRLKSLIAVFIVRIIDILLHPNDKLYANVRQFFVSRPTLQLNVLPAFYDLINSPDFENHKRFQRFIISWICDGLRTEEDIKLCLKRNVFNEMLTYFDSPLSDDQNQVLILTLLGRTCALYLGAKVLCTENALFCWLKQTILNINNNSNASILIQEFYQIVCIIWETISNRHLAQNEDNSQTQYLFYPSFCYEIIDIFKVIVNISPESDKLLKYSEVCKFIFKNYPKFLPLLSSLVIENLPKTITSVAMDCE